MANASEDFCSKVIGGHNITDKRPLFTHDGKLLIVPSIRCVRIYLVSNGQLLRTLLPKDGLSENEFLVNIQLHPLFGEKQVVCFTNEGNVIVFDYTTGEITNEYKLVKRVEHGPTRSFMMNPAAPVKKFVTFGYLFNYNKSAEADDLLFAYLLSNGISCFLYFQGLNKEKMVNTFALVANPILGETGIAFGNGDEYVVTVENENLRILELNFKEIRTNHHKIAEQKFTCVTCHPNSRIIAAGDTLGRIFIYSDDFLISSRPKRSVCHWHHLAVKDLCFSTSGTYLYSVGLEAVAIRWFMNDLSEKNLLPRLGFPLKFVVTDSCGENLAVSRMDNSILIIGEHFSDPKQTIEGLTFGFGQCTTIPSTGLIWDSRTNSLALNGRTGQLQFYSPYTEKQLYQIDVVGKNVICPRGDEMVYNVELSKAALSSDGEWLATIEMRDDKETLPEIRLKFWKSTNELEIFDLNTTIHLPHKQSISEIQFSRDSSLLVSTSMDHEFKIWHLMTEETSNGEENKWWTCGRVGFLNSRATPYCVAISFDSSVLAISFDSFITLWDISTRNALIYRCHLWITDDSYQRVVQKVIFGHNDKSHLLIECKTTVIRVWDIITLSIIWRWVPTSPNFIDCIALDQFTNNIAVFLSNAKLIMFNIESRNTLKSISLDKPVSNTCNVFSAVFIPRKTPSDDKLFPKSHLCFMCSNQELLVLLSKNESGISDEIGHVSFSNENVTPFAAMLINKKNKEMLTGESTEITNVQNYFDEVTDTSKLIEKMFINVPSHVLPPVEQICTTFLRTLLNMKIEEEIEEEAKIDVESNVDPNEDNEEVEEVEMKKELNDIEIEEEIIISSCKVSGKGKDFVFNEDYSWMAQ